MYARSLIDDFEGVLSRELLIGERGFVPVGISKFVEFEMLGSDVGKHEDVREFTFHGSLD